YLPEFQVILDVQDGPRVELSSARPTAEFETESGTLIPLTGSEGQAGSPRVFWSLRETRIFDAKAQFLVDGILPSMEMSGNPSAINLRTTLPWGVAVNLTDELRPEMSVDRTNILSARHGVEFAKQRINVGGWQSISHWSTPRLGVLLSLLYSFPFTIAKLS